MKNDSYANYKSILICFPLTKILNIALKGRNVDFILFSQLLKKTLNFLCLFYINIDDKLSFSFFKNGNSK